MWFKPIAIWRENLQSIFRRTVPNWSFACFASTRAILNWSKILILPKFQHALTLAWMLERPLSLAKGKNFHRVIWIAFLTKAVAP